MSDLKLPSFANQNLRHRSFRRRSLNDADFSGADIRGCDFSRAALVGANFENAVTGQTLRQRIVWLGMAIATFLVSGHAISRLVFGSLGQTPSDRAWNFVLALVISLGIAGAASGIRFWLKPIPQRIAQVVAGLLAGAIAGFFYLGNATANNPRMAITGAVLGGLGFGILTLCFNSVAIAIIVSLASAIAAYGLAFLAGATAISFWNTHQVLDGLFMTGLCLIYLWLTVNSVAIALHESRHAPGTRFRRANLTNANFTHTRLRQVDFTDAIGLDPSIITIKLDKNIRRSGDS